MRNNQTLKRLCSWELSSNNETIEALRRQREEMGAWIIDAVTKLTQSDQKEVEAMATIISASITYLVMLEDFCP